jgi:DNA topoisomerase-1
LGEIDAREINSIPIGDDIVVRVGRYGPYIQKGDERVSVPEDLPPDELTVARAEELLHAGSTDRVIGTDPATGLPVLVRAGRFGPYVQLGDADSADGKPRTASLLQGMDPLSLDLDDALRLLTLPRIVGVDPGDGQEIVAQNGRYGPYLKKGNDSRSLANEDQLFAITLDEAIAIFAQPKARRGQGSAAALRELGADPVTGRPILLKEGRFGPYVTDGETNASLRKGDTVEGLTPERAAELLADRRAAGPPAKKARGTKKAAAARSSAGRSSASKAVARSSATKAAGTAKKAAPAKKTAAKAVKKTAAKSVKKATGTARKKAVAKTAPAKKQS